VIVDDPHQVDAIHALELEREDVDLPQGVGQRPLETPNPWGTTVRRRGRLAQARLVDHRADFLCAHLQPFVAPEVITNPPDSVLRVLPAMGQDPLLQSRTLLADRDRRCAPA
jgi:hypothetical protein